ncbi:MAG: hypothetical protein WD037_14750 [Balneolales bacterium]
MLKVNAQKWKTETFGVVTLTLVIIAIYFPMLNNGFLTHWDDQLMLPESMYQTKVGLDTIFVLFTESYLGQYSPLIMLSYLGIIHVAGNVAIAFHVFGLLVHLLNFILIGMIIKKLLCLIPNHNLTETEMIGIAWGTAFLFAIHPLQVESVVWISASKILLYGFFYLLGLWFYLLYKQSGKHLWLGIVLLCFLLSLFTKEQAVVFVCTLVATDLVIHSKIHLQQKSIWLEKIPFLIIALVFGWFTLSIPGMSGSGEAYPLWQRIFFGNYSFWEYIIKLIAPYSLSHFYFFPMDPGEVLPLRFWIYPLATVVFCWVMFEYRPYINKLYLFGGLFFMINIAVVLHMFPMPRAAIIADRYIYLSAIGFFLIVTVALAQWLSNRGGFARRSLMVAGSLYLLVLVGYTHERSKAWENMDTLNEGVRQVIERNTGEFNLYEE